VKDHGLVVARWSWSR